MLRTLWTKFDRDWGWHLARMLAYACLTGIFSVVSLDLILLVLVLHVFGNNSQDEIVRVIAPFLPNRISSTTIDTFIMTLMHTEWYWIVLGIPLSLWWGTRFFTVMEACLCVIFRRPRRSVVAQNRAAFGMLLLFALAFPLLMLSVTVSPSIAFTFLHPHRSIGPDSRLISDPTGALLILVCGCLVDFMLLLAAYIFLTPGRISPRLVWPGAAVAALLTQGYGLIFPVYARDVLHVGEFGTYAGFVLVVLTFFFAYACFILWGAEVASLRAQYASLYADVATLVAEVSRAGLVPPTFASEPRLPRVAIARLRSIRSPSARRPAPEEVVVPVPGVIDR